MRWNNRRNRRIQAIYMENNELAAGNQHSLSRTYSARQRIPRFVKLVKYMLFILELRFIVPRLDLRLTLLKFKLLSLGRQNRIVLLTWISPEIKNPGFAIRPNICRQIRKSSWNGVLDCLRPQLLGRRQNLSEWKKQNYFPVLETYTQP